MNSQTKSPKLLVTIALSLAAVICVVAAGVSAVLDHASLCAGDPTQARRAQTPDVGASAALRLQSLIKRGGQLREVGHYKNEKPVLPEALALAEKAFGPDSFERAAVLNQLGVLGKYDGHFDEAEAACRRALQIMEETTGLEHPLAATLFHNLGGLEHARGRFAEGEPHTRQASKSGGRASECGRS